MAYNSANVSAGDTGLASQYNDLRDDVLFNAGDYATTSGTGDAYTLTISGEITALVDGQKIRFKVDRANGGASTLNVNGLGAKAITKFGDTNIEANDLQDGREYEVTYDGVRFQLPNSFASSGGGFSTYENPVFNYDSQLVSVDLDGTTYTHTFDQFGQLYTVSDGITTDTIVRDSLGRIIDITTT